jgi:hypothetical protein
MSSKGLCIGILIFIFIIMIVYVIVMFECARKQSFIFKKYVPKTPPGSSFHPLGGVRPLTQEEIDQRNKIIAASTGIAP